MSIYKECFLPLQHPPPTHPRFLFNFSSMSLSSSLFLEILDLFFVLHAKVLLDGRVDDGYQEIEQHSRQEDVPSQREDGLLSRSGYGLSIHPVQFGLLVFDDGVQFAVQEGKKPFNKAHHAV